MRESATAANFGCLPLDNRFRWHRRRHHEPTETSTGGGGLNLVGVVEVDIVLAVRAHTGGRHAPLLTAPFNGDGKEAFLD